MKIIDTKLLDHLSAQAKVNPRRRQNLNLHQSYDEPSLKGLFMLMAFQLSKLDYLNRIIQNLQYFNLSLADGDAAGCTRPVPWR